MARVKADNNPNNVLQIAAGGNVQWYGRVCGYQEMIKGMWVSSGHQLAIGTGPFRFPGFPLLLYRATGGGANGKTFSRSAQREVAPPLFCWLAIHWDCATDQQLSRLHDRLAESVRQTGMPSLQSCNAVEVDKTRASNHYSEFLYPFLYLKLFISTINAHFAASLLCEYIIGNWIFVEKQKRPMWAFCHEAPQFQIWYDTFPHCVEKVVTRAHWQRSPTLCEVWSSGDAPCNHF